ncbi:MAG TPA: diacylglycerol kinase family protein [Methylomirabilota bacterium]|nr:diacylglycerol kinase family protein [Methylomirabilota bacterium]
MKIAVIFNPVARGGRAIRFRPLLDRLKQDCDLHPTNGPGSARALAANAVANGYQTVVAAGGDGTVNEVLNGMADADEGFERARLAVLPLGTVNVFAAELRIPSRPLEAWSVIRAEREIRFDVVRADYCDGGRPIRRYFVQMAGAGWDARAVGIVDWGLKQRMGRLAYVAAALRALTPPLPRVQVECGGRRAEGELVLLGNGRFYAGGWVLFPAASPRDGLVEVTVIPRLNPLGMVRAMGGLLTRRLYSVGGARHLRGAAARLTSAGPTPFHLEGELAGTVPANFTVEPARLRVIVP